MAAKKSSKAMGKPLLDSLIPAERIASRILILRGQRILLDADLAGLYGVKTKRLNEQVKRNADRFPAPEFVFQLTSNEKAEVVANCDHLGALKFSPTLPHAFTEHGALMAAAVLSTPVAIQVSLQVVRAFVRIRQLLAGNEELARRVAALERRATIHEADLRNVSGAFHEILETAPTPSRKRRIGFQEEKDPSGRARTKLATRTRARRTTR